MPDYLRGAKFPLPDEWQPTGTRRVVITIPDDNQYQETLIGLLDSLRWSSSFDKDPTKTGAAIVSRTWETALDTEPIELEGNALMLRQNPANNCQLQQSIDGGETWTLAFDYSLCKPAITVPPIRPSSPTAQSDAAAGWIRGVFEGLLAVIDCELTTQQNVTAMTDYIRQYDATFASPAALGALVDEFCPLSTEQKTEYLGDCLYVDAYDTLAEQVISAAGAVNLDSMAEWLLDLLNTTGDAIIGTLAQVASVITGDGHQNFANMGAAGGGAGFGATCEWCIELTPDYYLGTYLENYDGGVGYQRALWYSNGWGHGSGGETELIQLQTTCPDQNFHVTTVTIEGTASVTEIIQIYSPNFSGSAFGASYTGGASSHEFAINDDVELGFVITYKTAAGYVTGNERLNKITICGTGTMPEWNCGA